MKLNGAEVSSLSRVAPWKNWTLLIVPSGSEAEAVSEMLAGAEKTWLLAGAVRLTDGS